MIAYKFLASGAVAPISGLAWPRPNGGSPGAWVEVTEPLSVCSRGVHVCRAADLAHWLNDELWELETSGEELPGVDCLVVRRARMVRRISAWSDGGAAEFAAASIAHAAQIVEGSADDARLSAAAGYIAVSAYCAALAVAKHLGPNGDSDAHFRAERRWQSSFIAERFLASELS